MTSPLEEGDFVFMRKHSLHVTHPLSRHGSCYDHKKPSIRAKEMGSKWGLQKGTSAVSVREFPFFLTHYGTADEAMRGKKMHANEIERGVAWKKLESRRWKKGLLLHP